MGMKIFRDGTRGVLVDDPADLQVSEIPGVIGNAKVLEDDLLKEKKRGNKYVAMKQYGAAMDVYVDALRSCTLVPTLLSNHAQAFISLEYYEHTTHMQTNLGPA
jgi:hypothetical protein